MWLLLVLMEVYVAVHAVTESVQFRLCDQGVGGPWDWPGYRGREEVVATLTHSFITALTPDTNSSQSGARLCLGKQGKGRAEKRDCFLTNVGGRGAHRPPRPSLLPLCCSAVKSPQHTTQAMELETRGGALKP